MGMLGAYTAHYYCDSCEVFQPVSDQINSASAANAAIRSFGWVLMRNGSVICDSCAKIPKHKLSIVDDDKREGGDWKDFL